MLSAQSGYAVAIAKEKLPNDVSANALPGFFNIGIPYVEATRLTLAGTGRYGVMESIGPVHGAHHEFGGKLAIGGSFAKWFSTALIFDGKYQKHPADQNNETDISMVGVPILTLRAGAPAGKRMLLGGELDIRIPGAKAPSLNFKATTISGRLLGTLLATRQFYFGFSTGFRLDNSENIISLDTHEFFRSGDRIALEVSEYNAFLIGIAMAYEVNRLKFILEADSQIYAAKNARVAQSPTRIAFGARYTASDMLQFDLSTETLVSKRPDVSPGATILPIQPRFLVLMGIRVTWGNKAKAANSAVSFASNQENKTQTDVAPPVVVGPQSPSGAISGRVLDEEDLPVSNVAIVVRASDKSEHSTVTDKDGNYKIEKIPTGSATITATAEYFDSTTFSVHVTERSTTSVSPTRLIQTKVGSQIRGLVRDNNGMPLSAHIFVTPGKNKTNTDGDGFFEINVDEGDYTVEILSPGFIKQKRSVTVGDNSVVIMNIDLSAKQ